MSSTDRPRILHFILACIIMSEPKQEIYEQQAHTVA